MNEPGDCLGLWGTGTGKNGEWLLMGSCGDAERVLWNLVVVMVTQFCEYIKKKIELYFLNGQIIWSGNYISIKLF